MRYVISATLLIAGIIHLMPLSGLLGADRLATLYGLAFDEPNLAILMRHRAVLLGMVGLFLVVAAFKPGLHGVAFIGGFVTVLSFLCLAWSVGGYNVQVRRVVVADVVALVSLIVGGGLYSYTLWRG